MMIRMALMAVGLLGWMILPVDAAEKDPMKVRVPADQLAAAQKLKSPVAATDVVAC